MRGRGTLAARAQTPGATRLRKAAEDPSHQLTPVRVNRWGVMGVAWPLLSAGKDRDHVSLCQALLWGQTPTSWEQAEPWRGAGCDVAPNLVLCPEVEALKTESSTAMLCDPNCQARPPSPSLLQACQTELEPLPTPDPGTSELGWRCQILPSVKKKTQQKKKKKRRWRMHGRSQQEKHDQTS